MSKAAVMRVMVVDDQKTMRELARYSLEQLGITNVLEAPDGSGAMEQMEGGVDLVISDYNMPNMDGMEFLRAVRAHPNYRKTPFILVTGRGDKELVVKAAQAGVNNYIVKPFTVNVLKEKIEQVMGKLEQ